MEHITKTQLENDYPEVFDFYNLVMSVPQEACEERMRIWATNGVTGFEQWTIPYYFRREKERTIPCLRLNSPHDGKCADCSKGECRFDRLCVLCGGEGHGAFQTFPGGKLKGELKCTRHRSFLAQMQALREAHAVGDIELRVLFADTPPMELPATIMIANEIANEGENQTDAGQIQVQLSSNEPSTIASGTVDQTQQQQQQQQQQQTQRPQAESILDVPSTSPSWSNLNGDAPAWPAHGLSSSLHGLDTPQALSQPVGMSLPPSVELGPSVWSTPMHSRSGSLSTGGPAGMETGTPHPHSIRNDNSPSMMSVNSLGGGIGGMSLGVGGAVIPGMSQLQSRSGGPSTSPVIGPRRTSSGSASGAPLSPRVAHSISFDSYAQNQSQPQGIARQQVHQSVAGTPAFAVVDASCCDDYRFGEPTDISGSGLVTLKYAPWLSVREIQPGPTLLACKGVLLVGVSPTDISGASSAAVEEVTLLAWPQTAQMDTQALQREIKTLRLLARTHPCGIARPASRRPLTVPPPATAPLGPPLQVLLFEYSDLGRLDRFMQAHASQHPEGLSLADLRCAVAMLTDALLHCHRMQVTHRDLRPSAVLLCRPHRYQRDLLLGQFALKLADFRLSSLAPLYHSALGSDPESDLFTAPEVLQSISTTPTVVGGGGTTGGNSMRNSGAGYDCGSDVWSLGLLAYYLGTGGRTLVGQTRELQPPGSTGANTTPDHLQQHYRQLAQRHGLHERWPLLHDLVDRTLRPSARRIPLMLLRCHPLLWPLTRRRDLLLAFSCTGLDEPTATAPPLLEPFLAAFDKYAPQFVFGSHGWVQTMSPALLQWVRPASVAKDHWWSGRGLLQAVRSHLLAFDQVAPAVYPSLAAQPALALAAYLSELTERMYPRLLSLVFELGGSYGTWLWDGDEVSFRWR